MNPEAGTPANWINPNNCLPFPYRDVLVHRMGQVAPQVGWLDAETNQFRVYGLKSDHTPSIGAGVIVSDVVAWAPIPQVYPTV